jgi:hypothetical protein
MPVSHPPHPLRGLLVLALLFAALALLDDVGERLSVRQSPIIELAPVLAGG